MIKLDDFHPKFIDIVVSFKIMNTMQTWVKGALGVPSYVGDIKGHERRSKVI